MKPLLPDNAVSVFFDGIFTSPRLAHPANVALRNGGVVTANLDRWNIAHVDLSGPTA